MGMGMFFLANSQTSDTPQIKRGTFGFAFGAYDFKTADAIRNSSLTDVLSNKQWAKMEDMDIAFGVSYLKGITPFLDYSINGYFGSVAYPLRTNTGTKTGPDKLLFEADASVFLKLLPDNYFLVPYISAGLGGSAYNGRFEAFAPLGAGLQFKLGGDHFVFSNVQYRVPITQGSNYHFLYSIGIAAPVGK